MRLALKVKNHFYEEYLEYGKYEVYEEDVIK